MVWIGIVMLMYSATARSKSAMLAELSRLMRLTECVPWAARLQRSDGAQESLKQNERLQRLGSASSSYPNQLDLEQAIQAMANSPKIKVRI